MLLNQKIRLIVHTALLSVLIGLAIFPISAWADTVVMRDGKTREGTVVEERADHILFEDPLAGRMRLEKSNILEIRRQEAGTASPASTSGGAVGLSEGHRTAGRYQEAFNVLIQAASQPGEDASALAAQFQKTALALLERAKSQAKSAPDRARLDYRVLYTAVVGNAQIAQSLLGKSTWDRIYATTREDLGRIDIELANSIASQPALSAQRKELLAEASAVNPENHEYRYLLAEAARTEGDFETAHKAFLHIVNAPDSSSDLKMRANDGLARVETASNGRFAKPTPVPTATPVVPVMTPLPVATPQPQIIAAAPTPEPTPIGPKWKQLLHQVQTSDIWGNIKELPGEIVNNGGAYLPLLLGIPALILLGWVLPYQFLRFRAHRGDLAAAEFLLPAKRYGICILVPYLYRVIKTPSATHRCPFCNKGIDNIEGYSDLNFFTCPHCRENITPIYDMRDYVDHLIEQLQAAQKRSKKGTSVNDTLEKDAMLKLVRGVLTLIVRRRASDLHLETEAEGGKIRARIDGIMYELLTLPSELTPPFISAIKVMANLDITERRVPQDGKIGLWIDKNDIDLRINTSPSGLGEKVTIRILNQKSINIDPTRLGLDGQNLEHYERSIHKPHGLIIVTGPSGSGKSTTLYVALNELNSGDKNIVTIEDPIEYHLKGISQMQVNPGANFTFANGLRSILRQDPDVIMVGEIRDRETAEAALEAATTGHLVLTTLHTIDAPSAFSRLSDLGVETRRIANAVNCIIAQRLVRTICPDCKKTYKPKKSDIEILGIADQDITYVHGAGCETCMNTGYLGRMAIYEFLVPNDSLREILEANAAITVIKELARKGGYRTLREDGITKVAQGLTTIEEVIRVTS